MFVYDLEYLGINKVSFYLALEEYLLEKEFEEDIFFIWRIDKAIVIGRNQLLESEINIEFAKEINVNIYRRPSGGGAIFEDEGSFMYSFITKKRNKDDVYKIFLNRFASILKSLGLDICFSGRNDLMLNNKKFSGTAFYQNVHGSCLHGTFLYDSNLDNLVKICTPSNDKLISKGIKSVKERVINVNDFIKLSKKELICKLEEGFLGFKIKIGEDEIKEVRELEIKFLNKKWIYDKKPPFTFHNKKRFQYGEVEVFLEIRNGKIQNINLKGDFFNILNLNNLYQELKEVEYDKYILNEKLNIIKLENYIEGFNKTDLLNLLFQE